MPSNGGNITYGINFNVDKTGLNDLKKSLQDIRKMTTDDLIGNLNSSQAEQVLKQAKDSASQVEQALKKAFNPTLNTTNITKFNQELQKSGTNLNKVYQDFSKIGINGKTAFTNLAANILTTNVRLKQTHNLLDSMGKTMINTVKWGIASSVMNNFTGSIQNAYNYVKALDSSLTDIRIVTGDSRAEMDEFAKSANTAAQALGRQTKEYTNAALAFYQQGLSDDEVAARTETTLKASNITGADVSSMADQLTAVWNGFQVQGEKTNEVVSKLAAIADSSASNMSELATAMSKSASIANNMGVDIDQLGAQISTIIATTRQAPQTVGNALKTIYARINDIKAGTDDAEISLGNYTSKMAQLGINVLDQNNQLRDTGQVMQEIGSRWGMMTKEQQVYLAQTMAGQRQMNNLIALFDHWDTYTKQLNISLEAQGTLDQKNARYMESLAAHTKQLQAAQEGLIQSFADSDSFKGFIDIGTNVINLFTKFIDTIGGGGTAILGLGSIFTSVFSGVISRQINNFVTNIQNAKSNQQQLNQVIAQTQNMAQMEGIKGTAVDTMISRQKDIQQYYSIMSEGQINHYNNLVKELGLATQQANNWEERQKNAKAFAKQIAETDDQFKKLSNSIEGSEKITGPLKKRIKEIGEAFEEANKEYEHFGEKEHTVAKLKEKLDNLLKSIHATKEQQAALNKAFEKSADMTESQWQTNIAAKTDEVINKTRNSLENFNATQSESGEQIERLKAKIKSLQTQLDELRNKSEQAFDIQNIVKVVGAVGQLATAWQSLANLPNTWFDDNLSSGEKFLRTITSLSMTLPMVYNSIMKMSEALGIVSALEEAFAISIQKTTAATETSTAVKEVDTAVTETNTTAKETNIATEETDTATKETNVAATSTLAATEQVENVVTEESAAANVVDAESNMTDAAAKDVNTKSTLLNTAAQLKAKIAIGLVVAAIALAILAYNSYRKAIKKSNQQMIKQQKEIYDTAQARQEQIKKNRQLINSYLDIYQRYKDGTASKEEMAKATETLTGLIDKEAAAVANLTGDYDALTQSLKRTNERQARQALKQAQEQRSAVERSIQPALQNAGFSSTGYSFSDTDFSGRTSDKNVDRIKNILLKYIDGATEAALIDYTANPDYETGQFATKKGIEINIGQDAESIAKNYLGLKAALEEISKLNIPATDPVVADLRKLLTSIETIGGDAVQAVDNYQSSAAYIKAIEAGFQDDIKTIDEFNTKRQKLEEELRKIYSDKSDEEVADLTTDLMEQFGTQVSKFEQQYRAINFLVSQLSADIQESAREALSQLSPEELAIAVTMKVDEKTSMEDIRAFINKAQDTAEKQATINAANLANQISNILLMSGTNGLSDQDQETIQKLIDQTENLSDEDRERLEIAKDQGAYLRDQIQAVQELRKIQKDINDKAEETIVDDVKQQIQDTIKELQQQREQLYKNAPRDQNAPGAQQKAVLYQESLLNINNQIAELQEKFDNLTQDSEEVQTRLSELKLENLNSDLKTATEDSYLLAKGAELIDENYTVLAENVNSLVEFIPDILDNATVDLETGLVTLSEDVMERVITKEQERIKEERDAALAILEEEKEELDRIQNKTDEQMKRYNQIVSQMSAVNTNASQALTKSDYALSGLGGNYKAKEKDSDLDIEIDDIITKLKELEGLTVQEQSVWLEGLDELAEKYPELRAQIQLLKNTQLSSSDSYQQALKEIQDLLDSIKFDQAVERAEQAGKAFEQAFNNISTEGIDQFFDALNQYTSAQYSVDILVSSNAEKEVEAVQQRFDQIADAAGKIGEGFIIASKDISTLNSVFPGIIDGMQRLQNGSYQLKDTVVQNAMEAAMAQVSAEATSVQERVAAQATLLREKAETYRSMAQAARTLASSQVKSEETSKQARATITDGLKRIKEIDSELAANKEMSDMADVANSSDKNAQIMASNWGSGAESSARSIFNFVQNAIDNAHQLAEAMAGATSKPPRKVGKAKAPGGVDASGGYSGKSGIIDTVSKAASEAAGGDMLGDDFFSSQDALTAAAEQWQAAADALDATANRMQGDVAQLGATAQDLTEGLQNVANGKGYSGDKGKGGGGGGGGKGGKDNTKTAEEIDKLKLKDQDVDKYHQIERAIKRIDDYLDEMSGYEEKTIRQGKSDTIDKEVDALQQQKALYEQKIQMMQADLQLQQADLALLGVQFDEQGNIINYTALMSAYQAQYNALLEEAKLLTGDTQQAKLKQAEGLKQQLESLKSQMSAYEALQDKIVDAGAAIRDIIDKEEQLRIKQFKIKIDMQLEFADAKRDWNKFKKEVIDKIKDDDYLGQAKARLQDFYSYYDEQGNGIIQQLTEHVNKTRQEAEIIQNGGTSSIYGQNQAQALEDLKKYTDELMQNLEDVQEIAKDIHDLYLDTIDKAQDAFDEQIDQYEQIDGIIEHDMNLLQLLTPEDNEQQLAHYYDQRAKNHNQEIDFYRKEADMWKAQMENAEKGTEEWKKFRDNWESTINDLNSAVEAAVENLLDKYNNTINKIVKDAKNQIMGGDWQKAMDEWDRAKWQDDRYLDMGTRATGVLDFVDKVNQAMNGQSPKVQKMLNDFLGVQVDYLNNITNLRQVDLDIAYKKLEVLQKQIALQEAQNNKSKMRLRRDSQGNYTYQYVAEQDEIVSKQEQLRDTLEELRQLAKVDVSDTIDEVQDKLQEFFDKAQQLTQTYYNDQDLLQQKLLELQDAYFGNNGYITLLGVDYHNMQQQLLIATGAQFSQLLREQGDGLAEFLGLTEVETDDTQAEIWRSILELVNPSGGKIPSLFDAFTTDVFQKNLELMSKEHQDLLFGSQTGLNPSWNTAIGNMAQNYYDMTKDVVIPCVQHMIDANAVYANDLIRLQQVAGITFSDIAAGMDADIAYTQGLIQANDYLIDTMNAQVSAIAAVNAQIAALCAQYAAAEQAAIDAANAAIKFWMAAQGRTIGDYYSGGTPHAVAAIPSVAPTPTPTTTTTSSSGGSNRGGGSNPGSSSTASNYHERTYVQSPTSVRVSSTGSNIHSTSGPKILDQKNRKAASMGMAHLATGGYTGEWVNGDTEGRLAVLHQKELVLNPEDTVNMLNAVKIASGMMEHMFGVNGSLLDRLSSNGNISNISNIGSTDASTNQNIIINADFPNANNADEIRQAFNNLINIASQRASGNRRTY